MLVPAAEDSYRQGIQALERKRPLEAQALFEAAMAITRKTTSAQIQPRYLSFYGYCLSVHAGRYREGIDFCREATQRENYNADLYSNLGESLLAAGRRREAFQAFRRGLALQPGHRGIRHAMKSMGVRRRPLIPFLSRGNRINIALGRLVASLKP